MDKVQYYRRKSLPLEMHKICIVQKTRIPSVEERVSAIHSKLRNNEARTAAVGGYILFSGIK